MNEEKIVNPNIEKVAELLRQMEVEIDWIDDNIISASGGFINILVEEVPNEVSLSFHVNTDPVLAAHMGKALCKTLPELGLELEIYECYAFTFDENECIKDTVFGEDAYETVGREIFDMMPINNKI